MKITFPFGLHFRRADGWRGFANPMLHGSNFDFALNGCRVRIDEKLAKQSQNREKRRQLQNQMRYLLSGSPGNYLLVETQAEMRTSPWLS